MDSLSKFEREVNIAVNRFARNVPWQDKEDLRQEARIALLEESERLAHIDTPEKLAYKIAANTVIDTLRQRPPVEEDIDKPSVRRAVEKKYIRFPDFDTQIDAQTAALMTSMLPARDAIFIQNLFGIDCEPCTAKEIARLWNVSEDWVDRNKKRILAKLRTMLTGANG